MSQKKWTKSSTVGIYFWRGKAYIPTIASTTSLDCMSKHAEFMRTMGNGIWSIAIIRATDTRLPSSGGRSKGGRKRTIRGTRISSFSKI